MKVRHWIYFFVGFCTIWWIGSLFVNNIYILPRPDMVFFRMLTLCQSFTFYQSIFMTFLRASISILISFLLACFFAYASLHCAWLSSLLEKIVLILRAVPNVTYVILLLFWVSRDTSVLIVSFLLLFPVIYQTLYDALKNIQSQWKDVLLLYPQDAFTTLTRVYLPLVKPAVRSSLINASSLAFKVGVMAEILASVSTGIGRQMQLARLDVELTTVMAWTVWLLIFVFLFDFVVKQVIHYIFR